MNEFLFSDFDLMKTKDANYDVVQPALYPIVNLEVCQDKAPFRLKSLLLVRWGFHAYDITVHHFADLFGLVRSKVGLRKVSVFTQMHNIYCIYRI